MTASRVDGDGGSLAQAAPPMRSATAGSSIPATCEVRRRPVVVGISGADGAGKSTLVTGLRHRLEAGGVAVATTYLYGCVICRRMPPGVGEKVERLSRSPWSTWRRALARLVREGHGMLDAAEGWLRLEIALRVSRPRGRREPGCAADPPPAISPRVLVTDRSPLDGLAKQGPKPSPRVEAAFRHLAARYDVILWLSAPVPVLAARDGEHGASSLRLASARVAAAAVQLENAVEIGADGPVDEVLDRAADVLGRALRQPGHARTAVAIPHLVVSTLGPMPGNVRPPAAPLPAAAAGAPRARRMPRPAGRLGDRRPVVQPLDEVVRDPVGVELEVPVEGGREASDAIS